MDHPELLGRKHNRAQPCSLPCSYFFLWLPPPPYFAFLPFQTKKPLMGKRQPHRSSPHKDSPETNVKEPVSSPWLLGGRPEGPPRKWLGHDQPASSFPLLPFRTLSETTSGQPTEVRTLTARRTLAGAQSIWMRRSSSRM